ncbi:anthrone oxygenase family protein [Cryobacterium aureum]|uniref:anthrone oxygenase family protein n=1 Tax=Cryobacterium aureum TaxID=995037 RepID=UPI001F0C96A4|nr:anthrone oxygenase family protein [Cryobacterium aureum]
MSTVEVALTIAAAVGAGLTGGVYLAFSFLVLPAFRTLPAAAAVSAMQRINVSAVRVPFMTVFFGGAAASVAVIVLQLVSETPNGTTRIVGAVLALAAVVITVVRNVPLNNALVRVDPASTDASAAWQAFDRSWSPANSARAAVSVAATVVLMFSLT